MQAEAAFEQPVIAVYGLHAKRRWRAGRAHQSPGQRVAHKIMAA